MKQIEKIKTQKIINKVQIGSFDENDVDKLFMSLREFSNGYRVFREIADFVAHNDTRNKGSTNETLERTYLSFKYYIEYIYYNKPLVIDRPFPTWIKKFINYQIDSADKEKLRTIYNVNKKTLKNRVNKGFKDNKNGKSILINNKLSHQTLLAIGFVMNFIHLKIVYTQDELIKETIEVIKKNDLDLNIDNFKKHSDYFTLCTLLLLHETKFDFKGYKEGYCQIAPENSISRHNVKIDDNDGIEITDQNTFGKLNVRGNVIIKTKEKDITITHNIITTNLDVEKFCDKNMFMVESFNFEGEIILTREMKIGSALKISDNRQLSN